jgi:hypothetical protein
MSYRGDQRRGTTMDIITLSGIGIGAWVVAVFAMSACRREKAVLAIGVTCATIFGLAGVVFTIGVYQMDTGMSGDPGEAALTAAIMLAICAVGILWLAWLTRVRLRQLRQRPGQSRVVPTSRARKQAVRTTHEKDGI